MDKLITVRTYNDYFQANAMLEVLKESGIQAMLLNENSGTILPSLAVGGIKLQVLQADEERATALIISLEEAQNEDENDGF